MKRMAGYTRAENVRDANALAELLYKLNFLPVPTIARVQGAAMGGGCGLVSCCDIALAADNAVFAFSEVKLGLIPATISPYVIRAIGEKQARRYFQTAERFDAGRAKEIGLVSEVTDESGLDEAVEKTIDLILANSSEAVMAAKQLVFDVAGKPVTRELPATDQREHCRHTGLGRRERRPVRLPGKAQTRVAEMTSINV